MVFCEMSDFGGYNNVVYFERSVKVYGFLHPKGGIFIRKSSEELCLILSCLSDLMPLEPVDRVKMFELFRRFQFPFFADPKVRKYRLLIFLCQRQHYDTFIPLFGERN